MPFDRYDRAILEALQQDGRISNVELAGRVMRIQWRAGDAAAGSAGQGVRPAASGPADVARGNGCRGGLLAPVLRSKALLEPSLRTLRGRTRCASS